MSNYKVNWRLTKIKNEFYVKGRIGWRGLKKSDFTTSGPYLITGQDFNNGEVDWNTCFHIPIEKYIESPEIMVKENDILLTKDGTIGKIAFIKNVPPEKASLNSHLFVIRNYLDNQIFPFFTYYLLQSKGFQKYIKIKQVGATRPGFSQQEFEEFEFFKPPLIEQYGIAEIIGTVDEAIRRTDAVIEKAEELKRGLIQRLLTRGIGHTEFKDTELGEIPKTWIVTTIRGISKKGKNSIKRGPWGGSITKEMFVNEGYKIYEQKNVIKNDFNLGVYYIDESKYMELRDFSISEGDILITGAGTIGKIAMVPRNIKPGIINQALIKITVDESIANKQFLKVLLENPDYQKTISGSSHGAAMKNFSSIVNLKEMKIALPELQEQNKIFEKFSFIDSKISFEKSVKNILNHIKNELMQILLSGKVRVRLDEGGLHRVGDG